MFTLPVKERYRLHLLALGDVGATLLLGLRLLGGGNLSAIGIYDVREGVGERYAFEMNQIRYPFQPSALPEVELLEEDSLFKCDVFVFCASAAVPEVGANVQDVRMAQLEKNAGLVKRFAVMARTQGFQGLFAVVSDPVDLLCQCAYYESNRDAAGRLDGKGLQPDQVRGYGLGVMHGRALYYAERDPRFSMYAAEGRAFGPHGGDLIIANSIQSYDHALSLELSRLAAEANLYMRALGYKPYVAPAISSGAISLLLTLRGEWHYSAVYEDDVYFGRKNRLTPDGAEAEELVLPPALDDRIAGVKALLHAQGKQWRAP